MKPVRTCVVCRKKTCKTNLLKITRTKDGQMHINSNIGRGAYICNNKECINKAVEKKMLNKVFKKDIPQDFYKLIQGVFNENAKN